VRIRLRMLKSLLREAWNQKGVPKLYFAQIRFLRWGVILAPDESLYVDSGGKAQELSINCEEPRECQEPSLALLRLLADLFQIGPRLSDHDRTKMVWRKAFRTTNGETIRFEEDGTIIVGPHYRLVRVPSKDYVTEGYFGLKTRVAVFDVTITRGVPDSVELIDDETSSVTRLVCDTSQSGRIQLVTKRKEE